MWTTFYALNLVGALWSLNLADLIFESQKIIIGIGLFLFFYNYTRTNEGDNSVIQGVFLSLIFIIIMTGWDLISSGKFQSTLFGHKNLLSSFLFLCLPFLIFRFKDFGRNGKVILVVLLFLTLTVLYFLNTRAVILALIISIFFYFMIRWSFTWTTVVRRWILGSLVIGGIVLIGLIFNYTANYKSDINVNVTNSSLVERIQLWNKTERLIKENPILGVGTGNWQYNYSKFSVNDIEKAHYFNTFFKRPHNDFLWILAENGVVGFLLIIIILGLVLLPVFKDIYQYRNHQRLMLLSAFIGLMVIGSFSFPKERITHICLAVILLVYLLKGVPLFSEKKESIKSIYFYGLLVLIGFNLWIGWQRVTGEYYTQKSIQSQEKLDAEGAIENGLMAISPFYTSDPSGTPILTYVGWGYNRKTDLNNLLDVNKKAHQLSPFDYKVLSNYGYVLLRTGQFKLAREILNEAYRINSNYEPVLLNLSVLEFNEANYERSLHWLGMIEGFELKYPQNLERIKERIGD